MRKKIHVLWHEIKRLKSEEWRSSLRWYVLNYVQYRYKTDERIKIFFSDLRHGCVSGMISELIHCQNTHKFYDKFYDDIEKLRDEYEDSIGEPFKIEGDLKNWFAWFGFEETAFKIANELNIDI